MKITNHHRRLFRRMLRRPTPQKVAAFERAIWDQLPKGFECFPKDMQEELVQLKTEEIRFLNENREVVQVVRIYLLKALFDTEVLHAEIIAQPPQK